MPRKLIVICLSGLICLLLLGVTSAWAAKYNEAPMLRVEVAVGELPPVEERLPEKPRVVEPLEEIGQYGGTIHFATTNPNSLEDAGCYSEAVLRLAPDRRTILPNLASYELSKDGKIMTLHLLKGMKWSDGAPFTADDFLFWYEDYLLNDELTTPEKPRNLSPGGELMLLEKIDDYTVRLSFAVPFPAMVSFLAHWEGMEGRLFLPKHYLKQFHPRYVPKEQLEKLAKEKGFDHWYQLFQHMQGFHYWAALIGEVDYPVIHAYVLKEKGASAYVFERNPYYWKVDTVGNQLPYIDRVYVSVVENPEVVEMMAITGELDIADAKLKLENYPLYMENAEKENYRVLLYDISLTSFGGPWWNLNHPDPAKRKILSDRRFRIAMSLSIDREEVNEVAFLGKGKLSNGLVTPGIFYEEKYDKAYTEHDLAEANRLLDEMGLDKRDKEGYRLRPDGERLRFLMETMSQDPAMVSICELLSKYAAEVGVELPVKYEERSLFMTHVYAGTVDVLPGLTGWSDDNFVRCPFDNVYTLWVGGEPWGQWLRSGGEEGEEPPQGIKRIYELGQLMQSTMDEQERVQAGKEICRLQAENLYVTGTIGLVPSPVIVKNNLRNIPEEGSNRWDVYFALGVTYPEQWFFKS